MSSAPRGPETSIDGKSTSLDNGAHSSNRTTSIVVDNVIEGKGEFLASGVTSLVERLPSGDVIKTPLLGRARSREDECRREMAIEARVYQRLGIHPRLVAMKRWDPVEHTLTLEYMPNGTLKAYMNRHQAATDNDTGISIEKKLSWVIQAAESVQLLHEAGIIHCDIGPHNFLVDASLNLRICDFSGSSIDGDLALVSPSVRYTAPDPDWRPQNPPKMSEDFFALGSTIYFIVTGRPPLADVKDDEVEEMYLRGSFPNVQDVLFGSIILVCWQQKVASAKQLFDLVSQEKMKHSSSPSTT